MLAFVPERDEKAYWCVPLQKSDIQRSGVVEDLVDLESNVEVLLSILLLLSKGDNDGAATLVIRGLRVVSLKEVLRVAGKVLCK